MALAFDPVALKAIAKALVLPPGGPLLLALVGLLLLARRPRVGRALAWVGVLALTALSLPVVSGALARAYVGDLAAFDITRAREAQAIVILGSGVQRHAPEYGMAAPGRFTLQRLRYGAWLARLTRLPVLVAGGAVHSRPTEAEVMQAALEQDYRITPRWVENESRNTRENAQRSAAILRPAGITTVVLVAHAIDMRRAQAEFEAAGLHALPAPIELPGDGDDDSPFAWLPNIGALGESWRVLYEALGDLVRRIGG